MYDKIYIIFFASYLSPSSSLSISQLNFRKAVLKKIFEHQILINVNGVRVPGRSQAKNLSFFEIKLPLSGYSQFLKNLYRTGPSNNNIKSMRIGVAGGEPCP